MNPPLQSKGGAPAPQGAMEAEKASGLRLCEAAKAHPVGRLSPREASGDLSYKNLAGAAKKLTPPGGGNSVIMPLAWGTSHEYGGVALRWARDSHNEIHNAI